MNLVFRNLANYNVLFAGLGIHVEKLLELLYFCDLAFRNHINYIGFVARLGIHLTKKQRNYNTFGLCVQKP